MKPIPRGNCGAAERGTTALVSGGRLDPAQVREQRLEGYPMAINTVGHLAEVAFHHSDIAASYVYVIVKLRTHSARGVTAKDFELVNKIYEVVMWQRGKATDIALEGTPDHPRFRYFKYDD
jgi:4a-hydroxytetrahydrobiopterin dehydratase